MNKHYLINLITSCTGKENIDNIENVPMLSRECGINAYECAQILLNIQDELNIPIEELMCLENPCFTISNLVDEVLNFHERRNNNEKAY